MQSWFQNRQEQLQDKVTPSSGALKLFDDLSDVPISSKAPEGSLNPKGLFFFSAWVQTVDKILMINILFNTCLGF